MIAAEVTHAKLTPLLPRGTLPPRGVTPTVAQRLLGSERLGMTTAPRTESGGLISARKIGLELGIPWRYCGQFLELLGVEILHDGPRRWLVRSRDWNRVRGSLVGLKAVR